MELDHQNLVNIYIFTYPFVVNDGCVCIVGTLAQVVKDGDHGHKLGQSCLVVYPRWSAAGLSAEPVRPLGRAGDVTFTRPMRSLGSRFNINSLCGPIRSLGSFITSWDFTNDGIWYHYLLVSGATLAVNTDLL